MPVNLKIIPPAAWRPEPVRFGYWFSVLAGLITIGVVVGLTLDRLEEETKYWLLVSAAIMFTWFVVFVLRLLFWLLQHSRADGWDRRREETLLRETRRGRRALQILHVGLDIPLPEESVQTPLALLMNGPSTLLSQPGRGRENEFSFHTFFQASSVLQAGDEFLEPEQLDLKVFRDRLHKLLEGVAVALAPFPSDQPVTVLFESDTSIHPHCVTLVWQECVQSSGIVQPVKLADGHGAEFIDEWLDNRINDQNLLLVIAIQVAPETRTGSTEATVALLLGNRMTQSTVSPLAWLHRPECTDPKAPIDGIAQAADWVPLEDGQVQRIWLSGLNAQEASAVIPAMALPLLSGVPSPGGRHNTDLIIGHAGCVSPWLAAAVATLATQQTGSAQLAISAHRDTGTLWTQAITPA